MKKKYMDCISGAVLILFALWGWYDASTWKVPALRAFGFLFSTPVFLFLAMLLFGERKWLRMVIISVTGTAVLYLFFVQIMSVRF